MLRVRISPVSQVLRHLPASAFVSPMDIFEVKQKERVSREEAAARLRTIADMLAQHNDVEFERAGMRFTVHVPDELDLKIELEVETDERERGGPPVELRLAE